MVKLQKQVRGNFIVAIPKKSVNALKWGDSEKFALCPRDNGVLRLVSLYRKGV
jgi:hypothetical protein